MATDAQGTPPPDWFASLLAQGAQGGATANPLDSLLQTALMGASGRQGLTSQPLVGVLPRWVRTNPQILGAIRSGQVDPYLPTNDPSTWQVYVGGAEFNTPERSNKALQDLGLGQADKYGAAPGESSGDKTRTVGAVANEPFTWSEDEIKSAIKRFNDAGMTNVNDLPSLQKAWSDLTQMAGARYSLSSGKIKVTPWDMLDLYKKTSNGSGAGGGGGFTGTHTSTQKTIADISQGDAWASLRQTTQQLLGHDPSDQEVRDFAYRMNNLAAAHPTISTTTSNYKDGLVTSSSTKTSGGFTANDIGQHAYQDAQSDPDYAEFQSATTYYNAMLSALGEIGG